MPRTKKAGLLTKLVILALLIYLATALLDMQSQIRQTQAERDSLSRQVAEQTQVNADLAEDVANPDDPQRIADIARMSWAWWCRAKRSSSSPIKERPGEISRRIMGKYGVWCRFYCGRKGDRHHEVRRLRVTARRSVGSGAYLRDRLFLRE